MQKNHEILILLRILFLPCFWCICLCSHILNDEKSVSRPSWAKDESIYHRIGCKEHLDRGDSKIVSRVSGIRRTNWNCLLDTDWAPFTGLTSRNSIASRDLEEHKRNRSILFTKDTARLRCSEGAFRVHSIYGDGNCMFRAISYILWQNEDEHRHLRTMVAEYIKENWHEYEPFVMAEWNISNCQDYYDYMNMVGTYASELECTVATKMYRKNLSIYREIHGKYELKRVFHNRIGLHYETARLLFTGNAESGHYDVLLPE